MPALRNYTAEATEGARSDRSDFAPALEHYPKVPRRQALSMPVVPSTVLRLPKTRRLQIATRLMCGVIRGQRGLVPLARNRELTRKRARALDRMYPVLSKNASVSQGVPPGLRIDTQTVGTCTDRDARQQMAVSRIDGVNFAVIAAREPQHLAVC
jgi:hypothetical protein